MGTPLFDRTQSGQQFRRLDRANRPVADGQESITLQPTPHVIRMAGNPGMTLLLVPLPGNGLEGIGCGNAAPQLVGASLDGRIEVAFQMPALDLPFLPSVLEPDVGVQTQRKRFFLTAEPIAQPPVLATVLVDSEVQPAAIGALAHLPALTTGIAAARIRPHSCHRGSNRPSIQSDTTALTRVMHWMQQDASRDGWMTLLHKINQEKDFFGLSRTALHSHLAERVGFDPTCQITLTIRFRKTPRNGSVNDG